MKLWFLSFIVTFYTVAAILTGTSPKADLFDRLVLATGLGSIALFGFLDLVSDLAVDAIKRARR